MRSPLWYTTRVGIISTVFVSLLAQPLAASAVTRHPARPAAHAAAAPAKGRATASHASNRGTAARSSAATAKKHGRTVEAASPHNKKNSAAAHSKRGHEQETAPETSRDRSLLRASTK